MSKSKYEGHTQGPWEACGDERGGCKCGLVWHREKDFTVAAALHAECKKHEGCTCGEGLIGEAQIKANAALIADAPDLLRLGEELRKTVLDLLPAAGFRIHQLGHDLSRIDQANAALEAWDKLTKETR